MKTGILPTIWLLCLPFAAAGQVTFPEPQGFINDFAGVLTAVQKLELDQVASSLEQDNGAELAVAIVETVAPLDPKAFAVQLFEAWGIGERGHDNGVLILLAMAERRIEIEVGYGLEGVLTDAVCGRLLDDWAIPHFRQGDMGEGTVAVARAVARVAAGESFENVVPPRWTKARLLRVLLVAVLSAFLLWLTVWSLRRKIALLPIAAVVGLGVLWGYALTSPLDNLEATIMATVLGGSAGMVIGLFLDLILGGAGQRARAPGYTSGSSSGGSSRSSSSRSSSSSSSSSSGSSSSRSSGSFGGGRSGGGGAGRSW